MTGFMPRLESLRGVAALAVAAFHINQVQWVQDGIRHPIRTCADWDAACLLGIFWWRINGIAAVLLFFVISGYVLTVSMQRKSSGWTDAPSYAASRALRLYPAVILMVALFAFFQHTSGIAMYVGTFSLHDVVFQSLLLTNRINGVTYTLQLEIIGSALLFIAFHADRTFRGWTALSFYILFSVLSFVPAFAKLLTPYGGPPLIFLSAFMAGMLGANLGPAALQRLSAGSHRAILIAAVLLFILTRPLIAAGSGWTVLFESLSGVILVAVLAQGRTGRIFDLAPLRFLGRISYSFYLLHPMSWYFIISRIDTLRGIIPGPDIVVSIGCFALSVASTLPIAWLSYRLVELPVMRMGKRYLNSAPRSSELMSA